MILLLPHATFQSISWEKRFKPYRLPILLHASLLTLGNSVGGGVCVFSFVYTWIELFLFDLPLKNLWFFPFFFFNNLLGNAISVLVINTAFGNLNFPPPCCQVLASKSQSTISQHIPLSAKFPCAYYSFPKFLQSFRSEYIAFWSWYFQYCFSSKNNT